MCVLSHWYMQPLIGNFSALIRIHHAGSWSPISSHWSFRHMSVISIIHQLFNDHYFAVITLQSPHHSHQLQSWQQSTQRNHRICHPVQSSQYSHRITVIRVQSSHHSPPSAFIISQSSQCSHRISHLSAAIASQSSQYSHHISVINCSLHSAISS